jgi:hypothetical protein
VLIAIAAICLQRAATLQWAATTGPDGALLEVSPIGVTRVEGNASRLSCRWWPPMGRAELCSVAPSGAVEFGRVRRVYPLLAAALWVAVAALFLQVLKLPRSPIIRSLVTWSVSALSVAAIGIMVLWLGEALALLSGRQVRLTGPGFALACVAAILSVASGALALTPGAEPPRPRTG